MTPPTTRNIYERIVTKIAFIAGTFVYIIVP